MTKKRRHLHPIVGVSVFCFIALLLGSIFGLVFVWIESSIVHRIVDQEVGSNALNWSFVSFIPLAVLYWFALRHIHRAFVSFAEDSAGSRNSMRSLMTKEIQSNTKSRRALYVSLIVLVFIVIWATWTVLAACGGSLFLIAIGLASYGSEQSAATVSPFLPFVCQWLLGFVLWTAVCVIGARKWYQAGLVPQPDTEYKNRKSLGEKTKTSLLVLVAALLSAPWLILCYFFLLASLGVGIVLFLLGGGEKPSLPSSVLTSGLLIASLAYSIVIYKNCTTYCYRLVVNTLSRLRPTSDTTTQEG